MKDNVYKMYNIPFEKQLEVFITDTIALPFLKRKKVGDKVMFQGTVLKIDDKKEYKAPYYIIHFKS